MMHRIRLRVIALAMPLTACGPHAGSFFSSEDPVKPLIISMSGYSSCKPSEQHNDEESPLGTRMFARTLDLKAFVEEKLGQKAEVMASCYNDDRDLVTSSSINQWSRDTSNDTDYINALHRTMGDYSHVYLFGHSYGGWLSMKTLESWKGSASLVKFLYTIDPISKKLCYFDNPGECLSAPRDIKAAAREHIKNHTDLWVNAWQEETFYLHSSPISHADENPEYQVGHREIDESNALWNDMKSRVTL